MYYMNSAHIYLAILLVARKVDFVTLKKIFLRLICKCLIFGRFCKHIPQLMRRHGVTGFFFN